MQNKISVFWFRRDLRLSDNTALHNALKSKNKVLPIFIFDDEILDGLPNDDPRVSFIYETLFQLDTLMKSNGSSLLVKKGNPIAIWKQLLLDYNVETVYVNKDYEPYAIKRDIIINDLLITNNIDFIKFKDQVVFEENDILKKDGLPYTVYTPYKNKWLLNFNNVLDIQTYECSSINYYQYNYKFPTINEIGFQESEIKVKPYNLSSVFEYDKIRDYPFQDKTSYLSPYLRFGLVSIREVVTYALKTNATFLNELIWREFFMQIIFHFPRVVTESFKKKYDAIPWRNNELEFQKWCDGKTGYPMVDAGMRELNATGYMHNRVRMITAGFLCKHLLIDWRWGEAYFAKKLLDYELSSNNGNWQWAAGTGCDSAPYFRVFNPIIQLKKFDGDLLYINKWIKNYNELTYPLPIVDHKIARERAINTYKSALINFV